MDWTELTLTVPRADAPTAEAVATALCEGGLYIEDYADLEAQVFAIAHVDLIEQELLDKPRDIVKIHLYYPPGANLAAEVETLGLRLLAAGVSATFQRQSLRQEDWENSWKQHYHPLEIGQRLAVVPSWEHYQNAGGRVELRLDPGMAFGTGTHETTALCLAWLDEVVAGGEKVLDVGCGSGILAVAALLLGAREALGVDIDTVAVRTANENAALNGVAGRFTAKQGDLATLAEGPYQLITANIIADAIIRLAPALPPLLAQNGRFIASGVITERQPQVAAALAAAGLCVDETRQDGGWVAIICHKGVG